MTIALTARRLYESWAREQTPYRLDPLLAQLVGLAELAENNEKIIRALMATIAAAGDDETSSQTEEESSEPEASEGTEEGSPDEGPLPEQEEGSEVLESRAQKQLEETINQGLDPDTGGTLY